MAVTNDKAGTGLMVPGVDVQHIAFPKPDAMVALAAALVDFQHNAPIIPKNRTATIPTNGGGSYKYKYADLSDIWAVIREPLHKQGLAVTQLLVGGSNGWLGIQTTIWHRGGASIQATVDVQTARPDPERKNELVLLSRTPQEVGSVITYYKRYALGAALGLSLEEDDDGAMASRPGAYDTEPAQDPELDAEIAAAREERDALLYVTQPLGWDIVSLINRYAEWTHQPENGGRRADLRNTRDVAMIRRFAEALVAEGPRKAPQAPPADVTLIDKQQLKALHATFGAVKIGDDQKHAWCSRVLEVEVRSTADLTEPQYVTLKLRLELIKRLHTLLRLKKIPEAEWSQHCAELLGVEVTDTTGLAGDQYSKLIEKLETAADA